MLWKWNVRNTERTVPSTEKNNLYHSRVKVNLDNLSYWIDLYDTTLAGKWLHALSENLNHKKFLEKNFCFLGFPNSKRDLRYLVDQLILNSKIINQFEFDQEYKVKDDYDISDFQNQDLSLNHDTCNLLHRYFEDLQGTAWELSKFYKQATYEVKFSIRQLNNLCHEIESWVLAYRKHKTDPKWLRPSQITTFLNAKRYDLEDKDFDLFLNNRYDRDFGGVYLHWSQVGKTLYEVFRDEETELLDEATCSAINHQKYYSGEFDIEWGRTINEDDPFKKQEMIEFRKWLNKNNYDWNDPKLALGYIKLGQVNLMESFGTENFEKVYEQLSKNLNITSIEIQGKLNAKADFPHSVESPEYRQMQIDFLKPGYDWSSQNG